MQQQAVKSFSLAGSGRLLVVIGLHVAAIYLIATSLGIVKAPSFIEPMEATLIETPQETKPVEPVKPELIEPTLDIAEPDVIPIPEVDVPVDIPSNAAVSAAPAEAVESAELAVTNRVAPA